ncbi:MAG TPA: glycoside hydrolase family 2 TIM barrel-domain containing protein [Jatrophihabitans sp.]|jgi:beta-galactosidase/beta-glucuronidase|uniref:glycoside hydrolase family 2 protein n=1 Tax=Jatrophihabitans sp. TaxID=1932789 RepID=UPI002F14F8DF
MAEPGTAVHPRPQLTRDRWFDLSGEWQFSYDDADVGLAQCWYQNWQESRGVVERTITVPFPPESSASGIGDTGYHRVLWYRRTFTPPHHPDERLLLHFGAVDYSAQVWVNGQLVAQHTGGHTPFHADITHALVGSAEQVVVVRAVDDPHDLEQPRGKQDWQERPHAIWYERTSGIWKSVWLEPAPAIRIEQLRWTPDVETAVLRLDIRLNQVARQSLRLRLRLTHEDLELADSSVSVSRGRATISVRLPQADMSLERHRMLWSPETPNLFEAEIKLYAAEDQADTPEPIDLVHSYAAMRSIEASSNRILLNGRPYFLRLVLDQCYWTESHLALPDPDAARREVELVRSLGFNGVRLHQKVADPSFLYWCDRLGLLVWAEMPAAYEYTTRTVDRITREWLEIQQRDYSHPCIIAWVPVNESWGVPNLASSAPQRSFVTALYHLTKALDSTRLVVGNDGWEQVVTDVITVHDYASRPEVLRQRYGSAASITETLQDIQPGYRTVLLPGMSRDGQPLMITEFGGISHDGDGGPSWHGYSVARTSEELLERYRALVDALLDAPAISGFCYTQFTDTLQEKNGLLTADRKPKADLATLNSITRRPSAAVPADEIGSFEYGDYPPTVMDTDISYGGAP